MPDKENLTSAASNTDTSSSRAALADSEQKIFGDNPNRDIDGKPIERGHGSAYASLAPHEKARHHALAARVAADDVVAATKVLQSAVNTLLAANADVVKALDLPKDEPAPAKDA